MKNIIRGKYKPVILFCIIISILIIGFGLAIYKCSHNENYIHYGNDDYIFVNAVVGSGRTERFYFGSITKTDYNKWINGENGTIFVYSTTKENWGNRLNVSNITTIQNYGTSPNWMPMNFW